MTSQPRLGMPTLIELDSLDANIQLCRRLGLSFLELNWNSPLFLPRALPAQQVRDLIHREGLGVTVHLPEDLDLARFQPETRQGDLRCVRNAIAWAASADVRMLTMHLNPGVYFTLPERKIWLYQKHHDQFLANLLDSMRQLMQPLVDSGARLLLENTGRFSLPFIQDALDKILSTFAPQVGLTWDVGHDAEAGMGDQPVIQRHVEHVQHLHLHDSDGKSSHQPLFTGQVDVPAALAFASARDLSIVVEVKSVQSLVQSIRAIQDRSGLRKSGSTGGTISQE